MKRIMLAALLGLVVAACSTNFYRGLAEDSIILRHKTGLDD